MKRGVWGAILGVVLAVSQLFVSQVALAAPNQGINLVTSPLPVSLVAVPGTTVSTDLRIKNGGTATERLKVTLMKFSAYGEEGKPALSDREAGDDYFDWVKFTPSVFDAPPNQWVTIKMTIVVPKSAAFGYYYAPVFSRAAVDAPTGKSNALVGSTAILVLLEAKVPNAKREVELTSFSADRQFYEFLPTTFTVKLHNSGNIHLAPHGDIFITQGKRQLATISINPGSGNVLPGTNRIFTLNWADGFPVYVDKTVDGKTIQKDGKNVRTLKWDFDRPLSKLRFGRYTAKLTLAYDNGKSDVPIEATLTFWVIPWRLISIVLVLLIPSVYWFVRYRRLRREVKQYRQGKKR